MRVMLISPCASGPRLLTSQVWNHSSLMGGQLIHFFPETEIKYSKAVFWNLPFYEWITERKHANMCQLPAPTICWLSPASLSPEVKVLRWSLLHSDNKWEWWEIVAWTVHSFLEKWKASSLYVHQFSIQPYPVIFWKQSKSWGIKKFYLQSFQLVTVWKASPELCKHFTYIIFLPTGLGVW